MTTLASTAIALSIVWAASWIITTQEGTRKPGLTHFRSWFDNGQTRKATFLTKVQTLKRVLIHSSLMDGCHVWIRHIKATQYTRFEH